MKHLSPLNEALSPWSKILLGFNPIIYVSVQDDEADLFIEKEESFFQALRDLFDNLKAKSLYIKRNPNINIDGSDIVNWSIILDEPISLKRISDKLDNKRNIYCSSCELHYSTPYEVWSYDGNGNPPSRISIEWNTNTGEITKTFDLGPLEF